MAAIEDSHQRFLATARQHGLLPQSTATGAQRSYSSEASDATSAISALQMKDNSAAMYPFSISKASVGSGSAPESESDSKSTDITNNIKQKESESPPTPLENLKVNSESDRALGSKSETNNKRLTSTSFGGGGSGKTVGDTESDLNSKFGHSDQNPGPESSATNSNPIKIDSETDTDKSKVQHSNIPPIPQSPHPASSGIPESQIHGTSGRKSRMTLFKGCANDIKNKIVVFTTESNYLVLCLISVVGTMLLVGIGWGMYNLGQAGYCPSCCTIPSFSFLGFGGTGNRRNRNTTNSVLPQYNSESSEYAGSASSTDTDPQNQQDLVHKNANYGSTGGVVRKNAPSQIDGDRVVGEVVAATPSHLANLNQNNQVGANEAGGGGDVHNEARDNNGGQGGDAAGRNESNGGSGIRGRTISDEVDDEIV